jgi:hypothetical protein
MSRGAPRRKSVTWREGEAGAPVTVVWLPGRRPEAARRAGLEFVEKLLTSAMVALLDGAEREHARHVQLVGAKVGTHG